MKYTVIVDLPEEVAKWIAAHPGTEARTVERYLFEAFQREQRMIERMKRVVEPA